MTKGKVVLVPFPFDDLSTSKVRPAVCLTNPSARIARAGLRDEPSSLRAGGHGCDPTRRRPRLRADRAEGVVCVAIASCGHGVHILDET